MNHIIIMAGGVGSRFWPMSTPERPKQFIDVLGTGYTLLQLTADRFEGICPVENMGRYFCPVSGAGESSITRNPGFQYIARALYA